MKSRLYRIRLGGLMVRTSTGEERFVPWRYLRIHDGIYLHAARRLWPELPAASASISMRARKVMHRLSHRYFQRLIASKQLNIFWLAPRVDFDVPLVLYCIAALSCLVAFLVWIGYSLIHNWANLMPHAGPFDLPAITILLAANLLLCVGGIVAFARFFAHRAFRPQPIAYRLVPNTLVLSFADGSKMHVAWSRLSCINRAEIEIDNRRDLRYPLHTYRDPAAAGAIGAIAEHVHDQTGWAKPRKELRHFCRRASWIAMAFGLFPSLTNLLKGNGMVESIATGAAVSCLLVLAIQYLRWTADKSMKNNAERVGRRKSVKQ